MGGPSQLQVDARLDACKFRGESRYEVSWLVLRRRKVVYRLPDREAYCNWQIHCPRRKVKCRYRDAISALLYLHDLVRQARWLGWYAAKEGDSRKRAERRRLGAVRQARLTALH